MGAQGAAGLSFRKAAPARLCEHDLGGRHVLRPSVRVSFCYPAGLGWARTPAPAPARGRGSSLGFNKDQSRETRSGMAKSGEQPLLRGGRVEARRSFRPPPPRAGRRTPILPSAALKKKQSGKGGTDTQGGMLPGEPGSATCVQRFDDSLNSAIRITYRISLRSSSLREPRYPLLRVVLRWYTLVVWF